jgi:phenylpyruvate tautomerase PptA (4-oxalocrotonate tautomerase family)
VTFHLLNSFPIPDPGRDDPRRRRVEEIAGRLAAVDRRYQRWAEAVGVPVGSVSDAEKPALLAELDALVAHLYGLERGDVEVIYETFDDDDAGAYSARCDAVIEHLGML